MYVLVLPALNTKNNICKPKDDFQKLAKKVRHTDTIVVGEYSPVYEARR